MRQLPHLPHCGYGPELSCPMQSWNYNDVPVSQELYSTTCGQFVVFYIYQRWSGLTLESITACKDNER